MLTHYSLPPDNNLIQSLNRTAWLRTELPIHPRQQTVISMKDYTRDSCKSLIVCGSCFDGHICQQLRFGPWRDAENGSIGCPDFGSQRSGSRSSQKCNSGWRKVGRDSRRRNRRNQRPLFSVLPEWKGCREEPSDCLPAAAVRTEQECLSRGLYWKTESRVLIAIQGHCPDRIFSGWSALDLRFGSPEEHPTHCCLHQRIIRVCFQTTDDHTVY